MKLLNMLSAGILFASIGSVASAHPLPRTASPKPDAVLTSSPTEIRIGFSEGLVAAFSGLELDDQNGKPIDTGAAMVDPKNDKELIVPILTRLLPGTYTVRWHAVGDDTHHVTGHYSFQVKA